MADGQGQNWTDQPADDNTGDADDSIDEGAGDEPDPQGSSEP
jgi:hypothetical protein